MTSMGTPQPMQPGPAGVSSAPAARETGWEQGCYDAEIPAACLQIIGAATTLAEGVVRLATLLVQLRTTGEYVRWGYATLEASLQTVDQIEEKAAYQYMRTLEALGVEQMRQLLMDAGVQRTARLAQIRTLPPDVMTALLEQQGAACL
jgi:hypothetical protein